METKSAWPKFGIPVNPYSRLRLNAIIAEMPKKVSKAMMVATRSMCMHGDW
jgi:hypothetical protein